MDYDDLPRGIRNKNPGNIKISNDQWIGLKTPQEDDVFFEFTRHIFGIRALARTLLNYEALYGINTVAGILNRWAPESENYTQAYISFMCTVLNVEPDTPINVKDRLPELVDGIIYYENGTNPYFEIIKRIGIFMAVYDRQYWKLGAIILACLFSLFFALQVIEHATCERDYDYKSHEYNSEG